jgi:hypothetical protein
VFTQPAHTTCQDFTRTTGGTTIRSRLAELGLDEDADAEIKCFVWLPMLVQALNPCLCDEPKAYLSHFLGVFEIRDNEIPADSTIYELVD